MPNWGVDWLVSIMAYQGLYQGKVKPIIPYTKTRNRFYMGEKNPHLYVYKYMPFSLFRRCLGFDNSGNRDKAKQYIYFQEPSQWKDQYESRFYNADYQSALSIDTEFTPRLYACCFANEKDSAAAWKIYEGSGDMDFCVQLKIGLKDLMAELCQNIDYNFYEGLIDYSLSNYNINRLHLNNGKSKFRNFYNGRFKLENFLSLLLIKRKAFDFEKEFRIFMIPKDQNHAANLCLKVPINWDNCLRKIRVERRFSDQEHKYIQELKDCMAQIEIEPSDINEMREKHIVFGAKE